MQDGAAAPAAAGTGGAAGANEIGNDGLTHIQRQVKSLLESEPHLSNPDGLTAEQVGLLPVPTESLQRIHSR